MGIKKKLLFRKIKKQMTQAIAATLIVGLGVGLFVTLKTVRMQYENKGEAYYQEQALADMTLYGENFSLKEVEEVEKTQGVEKAQGRYVMDGKYKEADLRCISLPFGKVEVNIPLLLEGELPVTKDQCAVLRKFAESHHLKVGDRIEIRLGQKSTSFLISAFVASPEYVYFAKNENVPMADPHDFGVVFLQDEFFKETLHQGYNQINVLFENKNAFKIRSDREAIGDRIRRDVKAMTSTRILYKDGQISYKNYMDDLDQIQTFAYVFPFIFLFVASMIIYVIQKRSIVMERKQIGIMKALGISTGEILWFYSQYALMIALFGGSLGFGLGALFGDYILKLFGGMFELPGLKFVIIPEVWMIAMVGAILICQVSSLVGVFKIMKISAAEAMHAEKPKTGKRIFLERIKPLWTRMSFNTRYALKNALRNKGRFWVVVIGMSAMVMIMIFALGFNNSFEFLIKHHYDEVVQYDGMVTLTSVVEKDEPKFLSSIQIKAYEKALMIPVTIESHKEKREYPLLVVEKDFSMMKLNNMEGNPVKFEGGAVLPYAIAQKMGIKIGEEIRVTVAGKKETKKITVKDFSKQETGFFIYLGYDYFKEELGESKKLYNTLFIKTGNSKGVETALRDNQEVMNYTSREADKNTLMKLLKTIQALIDFLVLFSVVLGIAVLYAVGIINLTARNYEYVLLKVMGYGMKEILWAYAKETVIQMLLAIPLGVALGHLVLGGIKDEFSNDSFDLVPYIYGQSYLLTLGVFMGVIILIGFMNYQYIKKINMVEGLKSREE